jgi:hypothetical protein
MAEAHNAVIFAEGGLGAPVRQQLAKSDDFLTIKINKAFIVRVWTHICGLFYETCLTYQFSPAHPMVQTESFLRPE